MNEKIIGGRYVWKKTLGEGGNGSVYLCLDLKLQKEWAVKELRGSYQEQEQKKENFQWERMQELEVLKTISNSRFPRIVDVIYEQEKVYLVMDYVEGITLKEKMQRQKLTEKEVVIWAGEIAKALSYLHHMTPQILYMDCKPENIMLTFQGEIKLVDLGSVYICHSKKEQRISGTYFFAPKEQLEMKRNGLGGVWDKVQNVDVRSDVYAFGMTLYYLLAGKKKIYRRLGQLSIQDANPAVSDGMNAFIAKCTQSDPKSRPQSMDEVLYLLEHIEEMGKQEKIKNRFYNIILTALKCICAGVILFCIWRFLQDSHWIWFLGVTAAAVTWGKLFLRKSFSIYEVKKEIFCGNGKRVLFCFLILGVIFRMMTVSVFAEKKENTEELEVTIYDQKGRKLLLKREGIWKVSEDIHIKIPFEELLHTEGRMTILYEDMENETEKKYEFFCSGKE